MEKTILSQLLHNENFMRRAIPYIKEEYFTDIPSKVVFRLIYSHLMEYNKKANKDVLSVEIDKLELKETIHKEVVELVNDLEPKDVDEKWIFDNAEKWAQDKALYLAIMKAVSVYDGKDPELSRGSLPSLIDEALSVSFQTSIGHDYIDDWEHRYDHYNTKKNKIPFHLDFLNKITDGGIGPKTLNLLVAPTGVGKSLVMCDLAAAYLSAGLNVVYITLEMSEEEIGKRIDANLMGIDISLVDKIPKTEFEKKVKRIKDRMTGKLIIEEYPTGAGNVNHFRYLLNELLMKKKFKPDIVIIDYINICSSARFKNGGNHNSYTIVKAISEEVRGLAIEYGVPIWSATQTNRSGATNPDYDVDQIAECVWIEEKVDMYDGTKKRIEDIRLGDKVSSHDEYKVVCKKHHNKMKDCVKITTKSGKSIIVSKEHKFPVRDKQGNVSRKSFAEGLSVGDILSTKK